MHNTGNGIVTDIVSGIDYPKAGFTESSGPFGMEMLTNSVANGIDVPMTSGTAFSVFTFAKYIATTDDHALVNFGSQDPLVWGDASSGTRAGMFAGAAVYGNTAGLSDELGSGYKKSKYHCWGAVIKTNDASSALYVDGVKEATGNPQGWTPADTATFFDNDAGDKNGESAHVWTIAFEGELPEAEALFLTQNPEALYEILDSRNIWIPYTAPVGGAVPNDIFYKTLLSNGGL